MTLGRLQNFRIPVDLPARPRSYRPRHALPPLIVRAVLRARFGRAWPARLIDARGRRRARQQARRARRARCGAQWPYGQPFPR